MHHSTRSAHTSLFSKLLGRREARDRAKESRRQRWFETLENRWMMHGEGADHVNGPHAANPTYDLNNFTIHADLSIWVNSKQVSIPMWSGVAGGDEIKPTNTSGTIQIHPLAPRTTYVTLGEVFEEWKAATVNGNVNAVFNDANLLNNLEDSTHQVSMFVNGVHTDAYEAYRIHDGDSIVLSFGSNPIVSVNTNMGVIPVELFQDKTPITVNNFLNYVNDGDYTNSFFHRYVPNFVLQGGGFKSTTTAFTDPSVVSNFTSVATDAQIQNEFNNFAKVNGTGATITTSSTTIPLATGTNLSSVVAGDRIRLTGRTDGIGGTDMFNITAVSDANDTVTVQTAPTGTSASNVAWTIFPKVNLSGTLAMAKLGNNANSATSQFFINLVDNDSNLDLQNGGFTVFAQLLDRSILTDIAGLNDLSLFSASLSGAQQVPAVTSSASGSATLAFNNDTNQFDMKLSVQGLTAANITGSTLNTGGVGVEGASFFTVGAGTQYTGSGTQLQRFIDNGAFPSANVNSLFSSQTYLNVNTSANPDGEIRGQLTAVQGGLYSDLPTTSTNQLVVIQSISGEGTVRGTIFTDTDNDGVRDQGENGRTGITVYDDVDNDGVYDTGEEPFATTDATGAYSMPLSSGAHKIRLVPTTGLAKTMPADGYDVTVQIGREVTGRDFGVVEVPALNGVDLLPATDSGSSSTDNITNFNNSTAARALQFTVNGAVAGAVIRIFSDGIVIGQKTVPAGTTGTETVTTDGTTTLINGARSIVATQELRGVQSITTSPLTVNIDTVVSAFTSTPPTTANVGTALNYNVQNPEEGQTGFVYALLDAPTGAVINASTGTVAWTPTADQSGTKNFQVSATDAAGNVLTQSLAVAVSKTAVVEFILQATDTNGNPITTVNIGDTFQLRASVRDLRTTGSTFGVFAAYQDVTWDGTLATASTITHSSVYGQGTSGTLGNGLIDEAGSFAPSITPLGSDPKLLYTATMTASRSGVITFTGNQPDTSPQHDISIYGQNNRVPFDEVNYGQTTLTVLNPNFQAVADTFNFDEDTSNNTLNVLTNDTVRAGATATIVSTTATSKGGTVTIAADKKSLRYTPAANFFGEDTFTYTMTDGADQSTATVKVQVVDVNDPPPAINDTFSGVDAVLEDSTGNSLDVLKNEKAATNIDQGAPNESLRVSAVGTPSNGGTVVIGAQGAFVTYTPAANFSGTETFTYTITDRSGTNGLTSVATATVTVTAQNDNPIAVNDSVTAAEDSQNNVFNLLANDSGEAGETLTITSVGTGSRGGQITIVQSNSRVQYTPAANVFGTETFTYTISDGNGGSATATATVTLTAVNDAPDAKDDTFTISKNATDTTIDVLLNDVSTPDDTETFTVTTVTQGSQGGVVQITNSGAKVSYRPAANFLGTETFTYTMRDPGGLTDTATVTVTVRDFLPSSLAGFVYVDTDNDGVKDVGESPLSAVKITLTGNDSFGSAVSREVNTDSTGAYKFESLPPGTYKIKETQPTGQSGGLPITDGKDTIGSQGGSVSANDEFTVTLAENVNGTGNNFGETTGFKVTGKVNPPNATSLAFNAVDVSLYNVDTNNLATGDAVKTVTLKADGSFSFDGISAGKYALKSESLTFLNSAGTQQLVTVSSADSVDNVVVQGSRQAKYISYRDYLNTTATKGVFAAVTPGTNGHQWSTLDNNWTGFKEAKVELSSDGNSVRIDVTKTTGEQLFDQVAITDKRVVMIAQEGTAKLLRLAGSSSDFNLRAASTAAGEGEAITTSGIGGEGESSSQPVLADWNTSPLLQPGTLDGGDLLNTSVGSSTAELDAATILAIDAVMSANDSGLNDDQDTSMLDIEADSTPSLLDAVDQVLAGGFDSLS